ncbi:MAG: bifunctional methylenetetrahydrofolate dehydrogenase/methenyltetrahydrofolate cyclohydrolase FolD [Eubacteriales bacterium]
MATTAAPLDGKTLSLKIKEKIKTEVETLVLSGRRRPKLAVVLVGENPASKIYVKNKVADCLQTGIESREVIFPETIDTPTLLAAITKLNADENVDGILVQLPLPAHIREKAILSAVSPSKDVDSFHPENAGKVFAGSPVFSPCTPAGIIALLDEYQIPIAGKNCVVAGRSNIVGKPMAMLLLARDATVTICHSKTIDLAFHTKNADIVVSAVGKLNLIDGSMLKPGAVIVDVGMNRFEGKLYGDCNFESCAKVASYITPVPGGVGPMTRAMLLKNTMKAYYNSKNKQN